LCVGWSMARGPSSTFLNGFCRRASRIAHCPISTHSGLWRSDSVTPKVPLSVTFVTIRACHKQKGRQNRFRRPSLFSAKKA
jgi:hypothetical protein